MGDGNSFPLVVRLLPVILACKRYSAMYVSVQVMYLLDKRIIKRN